jgi:hypothetical protein
MLSRTLATLALSAPLVLSGCGGPEALDIRCYAAASVTYAGDADNPDAAALMAYYLGRVDAGSRDGDWPSAARDAVAEFNEDPARIEAIAGSCMARMRDSMARQRAAF